jgi:hypothetical protein
METKVHIIFHFSLEITHALSSLKEYIMKHFIASPLKTQFLLMLQKTV